MAHPTTVTTWQRRQYARNTARRAANTRAGIATIGGVLAILGAVIAILGASYPGGIILTFGALVIVGTAVS